MDVVRGLSPPSGASGRVYPVVWPAPGAALELTMLDVAWVWVPVHWHTHHVSRKRTSDLCPTYAEWCRCDGETALSWRGYCPAWNHHGRYVCLLNIDPATARTFCSAVGTSGRLYLSRFKVERVGEDRHGRIAVTPLSTAPYKWEGVRPDMVPTLTRYYGDDLGATVARVQAEGGEPC